MKGKSTFTTEEAEQIIFLIEQKLKSDTATQKIIRSKIRSLGFYASDFGKGNGYTVADFLGVIAIKGNKPVTLVNKKKKISTTGTKTNNRKDSDESYILNLCDKVLALKGLRQHRFDFLKGDTGTKLPVDIYYSEIKLVIEYREKQHSEEVKLFDKRMTASGVSRGEQRKKYDELRRTEIPNNGLDLIEFDYSEFGHTKGKRLLRNREEDEKIIREKLKN